jgi:cellulose synthase/poly-beta-1,6-N-acetylglucosamine synthase-like glycosyltransferase
MMLWPVLFVAASALIFHSYVLFPAHMLRLQRRAPKATRPTPQNATLRVDVLMAAYNEAEVIAPKVHSVLNSQYPADKLRLLVGSDASTDGTDELLQSLAAQYPGRLIWHRFEARTGKPPIINQLAASSQADILVITDADALFHPLTISALVAPFEQAAVGGVQAHANIRITENDAVARQEASYTQREMAIKAGEGVWGCVIGGFGAAYALRRHLFRPVPQGFVVDDFYTFADLNVQGYQTVFSAEAVTELQVSGDQRVQFRRKRRIGKGNFQNLWHFKQLLFGFNRLSYVFWSHKALRWLSPLLLFTAFVAALLGSSHFPWLLWAAWGMAMAIGLASVDLLLHPWGISNRFMRFLSHFLLMNLALLLGWLDYLRGNRQVYWNNRTAR